MGSHQQHAAAVILLWLTLVAIVLYLKMLRSVLQKCAPASRTMTPEKVWLILIPFFGLIWQFIVVRNIARSLKNEFARLAISGSDTNAGQAVGFTYCVCVCCLFLPSPLLCGLAAVTGFIFWTVYWIGIASCSRLLETSHCVTESSSVA
jgi:hypothetical protein